MRRDCDGQISLLGGSKQPADIGHRVVLSHALANHPPQVTPSRLRKSICGSVVTKAVCGKSNFMSDGGRAGLAGGA